MFSLIRLSPPRHAVRRQHVGIVRHPATKVVATPLVTATTLLAMDSANLSTSAVSHSEPPTTPRAPVATPQLAQAPATVPPTTAPAPTTVPVAVPPPTTATAGAVIHLHAVAARPRPHTAPARKPGPKAAAAAPGADPLATAARGPHTARSTALGDFAGSGEPAAMTAFAAATGARPALASDYLLRTDGWDAMDGVGGSENWMLDQWRAAGYRVVLGVPIIPGGSGATLAQGAAGTYNGYFTILAQTLVSQGAGNAILRLGWEFNGNWYPWSVASDTDAENFAAYWRQIVDTMRAVPGQQFRFLWNPNGGGSTSWNLELAYPGSAYVDYIGTDVYDEYWGTPFTGQASWANAVNQSWGLNWLVNFAAAQGRPVAIPEWSVDYRSDGHGLGDDPYFMNQFATWIAANDVAFTCIFSYNDTAGGQDNDITDGRFPNALAAFRADFG